MEDWVTIRNLKLKNPDLGTRAIAKMLGVSRNTVKKALKCESIPTYERKEPYIYPELESFEEFIKESYLQKNLKVSRILKDMESKGYKGSRDALYRYVNKNLKPFSQKENNTKAFKPYSTEPGEQMQYDWAEYMVEINGSSVKIYVHQTILGYSRYKCFDVSLTITQNDVFNAIEQSFLFFAGVCERIQVDNAKVFVDNASVNNLKWNRAFIDFCGFFRIKATRSLPYSPWSKGKVEKPFSYLENHFIKGNSFSDFNSLRNRLKSFQDEVNLLMHGSTKKVPKVEFQTIESSHLKALAINQNTKEVKRYISFKEEFRKVAPDCLVSYKSNRYSVPYQFATKEVWVKVVLDEIQIFSNKTELIATHKLSLSKGNVIINKAHYGGYREKKSLSVGEISGKLKERFAEYTQIDAFIDGVKNQKRINSKYHLNKIYKLFEYYEDMECILAMDECFNYSIFNANIAKGYLTNRANPKQEKILLLNREIPKGDVKRDLKEYKL